jgi:type I restriction-modification system DNA methylase subunit
VVIRGAIDLFWKGRLLAEHKSCGVDLEEAAGQAFDYAAGLASEGRHNEAPRYILVSDFQQVALFDLEPPEIGPLFQPHQHKPLVFQVADLHSHVRAFGFMLGMDAVRINPEDPANAKAFKLMCNLHDELEQGGFTDVQLERLLVRILYCLFAEDTGLFEPDAFANFIKGETREDGSDLGARLNELFDILDTSPAKRQKHIDPELAELPHVNGKLFAEPLKFARFTGKMREELINCTQFYWARISPAIFGSLFQGILDKTERRAIGAHYTSERDILKVVRPLFLDEMTAEFETIRADKTSRRIERLRAFQKRLASLRFLDPACGCGSFLIIAYRELRALELEVVVEMLGEGVAPKPDEIHKLFRVNVDQFFGIEQEEWPARIAEVALWLTDHQMNVVVTARLGERLERLPLESSPRIVVGNALRIDWNDILPRSECSYVLGNPPFAGKKEQKEEQKADLARIWAGVPCSGDLDYVTCWYRIASDYIAGTTARAAFVSTNSISQGEQVGVLWSDLLGRGIRIHFGHTTFAWESEARGKAHVHVVVFGFAAFDVERKTIYEYLTSKGAPHTIAAKNINPYLTDGPDVVVRTRRGAINGGPSLRYGSMMIDKPRKTEEGQDKYGRGLVIGGDDARAALIAENAAIAPYIRRCCGGDEYINGDTKWCLWLVGAPPDVIRSSPSVRARVEGVRQFRLSSGRPQTQSLASTPGLFGERRQPSTRYLLVPKVSSESRRYIPIGFVDADVIATGSALIMPDATLYDFGVLSSSMHNAWMRTVGGRMKSDYQYSSEIVYNNFPWPEQVSAAHKAAVEGAAQAVLDARDLHSASTLATLYDPVTTPPECSYLIQLECHGDQLFQVVWAVWSCL